MGDKIIERFKEIDISDFPDFYNYKKPLEMGLWVLWVAKEKLHIKKLTAEEIANIIREVKEISVKARSINNAFARSKGKVHIHHDNGETLFEIMKPGKDHLLSMIKKGAINIFYFEPEKKYSSKRVLSKNILEFLQGELKIVDPYCGERTLDVLNNIDNKIKFLTRLDNLRENKKKRFLRELEDFKSENPHIEFRDYPFPHLHDRFIISSNHLVLLGHSIKDLGSKESFAIVLNKENSKDVFEAVVKVFNRRWKDAKPINTLDSKP